MQNELVAASMSDPPFSPIFHVGSTGSKWADPAVPSETAVPLREVGSLPVSTMGLGFVD